MLGRRKLRQNCLPVYSLVATGFSQPSQANKASRNGESEPKEIPELNPPKIYKKRKPERKAKGKKKNCVDIKIIHSNVDGYTSKKESVIEIVEKEKPDVLTLNDTNLKGKLKVKVHKYFSYNKNREKFKGGVSTVIANHLKHNTMKVTEGTEHDEYIVTRFDHTVPPINIVNVYGAQESRNTDSDIEKSWLRLMKDVKDIETRNEATIIIGDMNCAIGDGQYGINGNKSKVSFEVGS